MTASIKHSIRYFGVNAEDVRVPCTKGMKGKDWSWAATCTPCGWDSESAVAHAEIVELVATHKAGEPAAPAPVAPAPVAASEAEVAYRSLTAKGKALMAQIGNWSGSFFDNGIAEGSGAWGEVLAGELDLDALGVKNVKGVAGVLTGTKKAGLWDVTPADQGDDSDFWYLTALGAEVAKFAAAQQ